MNEIRLRVKELRVEMAKQPDRLKAPLAKYVEWATRIQGLVEDYYGPGSVEARVVFNIVGRLRRAKTRNSSMRWSWSSLEARLSALEDTLDSTEFGAPLLQMKGIIHSDVYAAVAPNFQAGKYSEAVYDAFRPVEELVRAKGGFSQQQYGRSMMGEAFKVADQNGNTGKLTDTSASSAEQHSERNLFDGAFGLYRNSTAHHTIPMTPREAVGIICLASTLYRRVEARSPAVTA